MSTTHEPNSRQFASLLKRLGKELTVHAAPAPEQTRIDALLVRALLMWEASTAHADAAQLRLAGAFIDDNELRVSTVDDIALVLGERYPLAEERSLRLRMMLNDVFRREHSMSLDRLRSASKREAREYLRTLEGCPEYAASFVLLHGLGVHSFPVDERLAALLVHEQVADPSATAQSLAVWIEQHVAAGEAAHTQLLLQAWSDRDGQPPKRERKAESEGEPPRSAPSPGEKGPRARKSDSAEEAVKREESFTPPQPPLRQPDEKRSAKAGAGSRKSSPGTKTKSKQRGA